MSACSPMSYLAAAALAATPLGQSSHPSPIRAYRDQAVFSTAPAGSKTFTLQLADAERRPSARRRGPRRRCRPTSRAGRRQAARSSSPRRGRSTRSTRGPARAGASHTTHDVARSPVIWGNRIAWIEGQRPRLHRRCSASKAKRVPTAARDDLRDRPVRRAARASRSTAGRASATRRSGCSRSTGRAASSCARSPAARPTGPSSASPSTAARCTSRRSAPATRRAARATASPIATRQASSRRRPSRSTWAGSPRRREPPTGSRRTTASCVDEKGDGRALRHRPGAS